MEMALALALVIGATAAIRNLGRLARRQPFSASRLDYVNRQSTYQALLLALACAVLAAVHFMNGANLAMFLSAGHLAAPAHKVAWLGIPEGLSWLGLGACVALLMTCGTTTFVYFQFRRSGGGLGRIIPFLPWVMLVSATNAFSEEAVYRLGVVVPLAGAADPAWILLISAVAFGAPHLRGMPGGVVGALMAGVLGWLLAKSVLETQGIFWAWLIHALQDIVVFSAFVLAAVNEQRARPQ